jgi:hypothetical protein
VGITLLCMEDTNGLHRWLPTKGISARIIAPQKLDKLDKLIRYLFSPPGHDAGLRVCPRLSPTHAGPILGLCPGFV